MRLGGIDIDPVVALERCNVKPRAIRNQGITADTGNGGFEMEASGDRNGNDFVVVRSKDGGELADPSGVAAPGKADEEFAGDAKNVAALECAGEIDVFELSKCRKRFGERSCFGAARIGAKRQDDGQLVEDDSGVFDEHGIWKRGFGGQRDDAGAQSFEEFFVSVVLLLRSGKINRAAIDERNLTMDDGRTDGARDGGEHRAMEFTLDLLERQPRSV